MLPIVIVAGVFVVGVLLAKSIKVVAEDQRVLVVRLGKPIGVEGPGIVMVFPFIDSVVRVRLDEVVPEWRSLGPTALRDRVFQWFVENPEAL